MKMLRSGIVIAGIFLANVLLANVPCEAVVVIVSEIYATNLCSSGVATRIIENIEGVCKVVAGGSTIADCGTKTLKGFNQSSSCSGNPSVVIDFGNCSDVPVYQFANQQVCVNVPGSTLLTFVRGGGCNTDGSVLQANVTRILNNTGCVEEFPGSSSSIVTVFPNNSVRFATYALSPNCTGPASREYHGILNQCVNGIKFSTVSHAASPGARFGFTFAIVALLSLLISA